MSLAMLTERAREWVAACTGDFSSTAMAKDIGVPDAEARDSIMADLCSLGECEATGRRNGEYRRVDRSAPVIDWRNAKIEYFPLRLPFGLDRMARVNPGGLVFVGGETNGGKSYFSMLIGHMNLAQNGGQHRTVRFLNSETVAPVINENAARIDADQSSWDGLDVRSRSKDFHMALLKDGLTIIDYLHLTDNFYDVGKYLERMIDPENIGTGCVVVFMQKKKGAELALGGSFTQYKPALSLSLNAMHGINSIKIDKLKMPTKHPNPEGAELDFKFSPTGGTEIVHVWRYLTKKDRETVWKQYERERALDTFKNNFGEF